MKELNDFKDVSPVIVHAEEGTPYKLSCNPPDGHPKPMIMWKLKEAGVIDSPRITTDPDGNLWFSNVTLSDNSTASSYSCSAFNGYSRTGGPLYLIVNPKIEDSYGHKPVIQYVSKKNTTALVGQSVSLWCIVGGTPLPVIKWTKNGKSVSGNSSIHSISNYGKTLIIKYAQFPDEASYECTAENGIGEPFSHIIHLTVYSAPRFTKEPDSLFTFEGEQIKKLFCTADGKPTPEIKWTFNGKLLKSNGTREVLTTKIVIRNVSKEDMGNYGCNASNEYGYVYKDTILSFPVPAKIVEKPRDLGRFTGNYLVRIGCTVEAFPDPEYFWSKEGIVLENDTLIQFIGNLMQLEIPNVNLNDSGTYTCHVSNAFGSDNASATLFVYEPLKIVNEPKDVKVLFGETVRLDCRSNIRKSFFNITTNWYKDEEKINFNRYLPRYRRHIQSLSSNSFPMWKHFEPRTKFHRNYRNYRLLKNNSLIVKNVTFLDNGIYQCFLTAYDGKIVWGTAKAEAVLTVVDVPDAPHVNYLHCKSRTANIGFRSKKENGYPILFYRVEYNTSVEPELWKVAHEKVPPTEDRFRVSVRPWTNYTFRVFAHNQLGSSLSSNLSDLCITEPAVPERNPVNVKRQDDGSGFNMIISWKPMPKIEHNGPNFMYVVDWKPENGKANDWKSVNISDWSTGKYVVKNITSFRMYSVRVRAVNEVGGTATSADIIYGDSELGAHIENQNWMLPLSSSLTTVILLLVVALILVRRYYRKALVSQAEMSSFFQGNKSTHEKGAPYKNPYDKERYEVDKKSFNFVEDGTLGSGEFGLVCKGYLNKDGATTTVAIKMTNPSKIHRSTITGLLSEIKVLAYVAKHENITELLGANTVELKQGKVYILLEMCPLGSLEKYLRNMRSAEEAQLDSNSDLNSTEMVALAPIILDESLSQDLFRWSQEICNGMAFLATKHVVHADLATRNVLLGANKEAKICDFGLSRRMYNYASYVKSQQEPLPWKWMAPESLGIHEFNEKTDVWSFGVTLWEMYSLGDIPYQGLSWDPNFVQMLRNGFRLGQPEFNERNMYAVMKRCWNIIPEHRPKFDELQTYLADSQ